MSIAISIPPEFLGVLIFLGLLIVAGFIGRGYSTMTLFNPIPGAHIEVETGTLSCPNGHKNRIDFYDPEHPPKCTECEERVILDI